MRRYTLDLQPHPVPHDGHVRVREARPRPQRKLSWMHRQRVGGEEAGARCLGAAAYDELLRVEWPDVDVDGGSSCHGDDRRVNGGGGEPVRVGGESDHLER